MSKSASSSNSDDERAASSGGSDAKESSEKPKTYTIYILNISFESSEDDLKKRFSEFGKVVSVYIPMNRHGGSKGFGFVEYETKAEAEAAIAEMHKASWEGRVLRVEFSRSGPTRRRVRPPVDSRRSDDHDRHDRRDRRERSDDRPSRRDRDRDRGRDRDRDRDRYREERSERRRRSRRDYSDDYSPPPRRRRSWRRSDSD
jgi:RNA recognition motif-containing protein